ncbi:30S ribosomal protein S8 [Cephaloticoccus capnophilus]|uniref:Small ribosomal subunit protein uS8 n=1 Tax=Cephaloticoccus capnophilus TaxID=1548208 RepID=A0A139SJQ5_9BACT|nr:30S ribosomal protein S8 [Cephaloticoccus capnophilus]KXU34799.1 30S ribosomal protein S8 [Cephaloticoccus capnophilus]
MHDPISDFLTRLRNASRARLAECSAPHSKLKESIASILKGDGYIADYTQGTDSRGHKTLVVKMKYVDGQPVLTDLQRVSKPGRRLYYRYTEIPRVLNGLGISILSTSQGLMKDQDCRRNKAGGELVCKVW